MQSLQLVQHFAELQLNGEFAKSKAVKSWHEEVKLKGALIRAEFTLQVHCSGNFAPLLQTSPLSGTAAKNSLLKPQS